MLTLPYQKISACLLLLSCIFQGGSSMSAPARKGLREIEIHRLLVDELPEESPLLVVTYLDTGKTVSARYVSAGGVEQGVTAQQPLVLIIRSGLLSTPDEIKVTEASQDGQTFRIMLEERSYQGQLFANVVTTALVQVRLGHLPIGDYQALVSETKLSFQDIQHPENATNPVTKLHSLRFKVH
jgi:hypothetical protein